jgi:hypothetical protein
MGHEWNDKNVHCTTASNMKHFNVCALALAFVGSAVFVAPTPVSAQSFTTSGSGPTLEIALNTFRGNAHSNCTRYNPQAPGFDFTITEARETGETPAFVVRGSVTCNGSQPISREEFMRRASPR